MHSADVIKITSLHSRVSWSLWP